VSSRFEVLDTPSEPEKKRKHGKHPYTKYSLEYIRAQGKLPWIVERLIPSKPFMKRVDLWNLFDIAYLDPATNEIGFVQTTSWAQRSAHKKKMLSGEGETSAVLGVLLAMGNAHVDLYGWRKEQGKWQVTVERLEQTPMLMGTNCYDFAPVDVPSMKEVRAQARSQTFAVELKRRTTQ
jgi:hypothetical protein